MKINAKLTLSCNYACFKILVRKHGLKQRGDPMLVTVVEETEESSEPLDHFDPADIVPEKHPILDKVMARMKGRQGKRIVSYYDDSLG